MSNRVSLLKCQRFLLIIWLVGLFPAMMLMITRSLLGGYYGKEQDIWAWFVPMFLPTLTLMIGAYSSSVLKEEIDATTVDKFFFQISLGFSAFYVVVLSAVVIYQPFASSPALETLSRSSIFLSVIQGMTSACLGVFFVSQKK